MTRRGYSIAAMTIGLVAATACTALVALDAVQCTTNADCAAGLPGGVCVDSVCERGAPGVDSGVDAGVDAADASGSGDAADEADVALDPWRCLSDPPEQLDPSAQLNLTVFTCDALSPIVTGGATGGSDLVVISATPLPGVAIQPCNLLDTACTMPVAAQQSTDDGGNARFILPGDFAGYFQMTQANLFPSLLFPGNPLPDASFQSDPSPLLSIAATQGLAGTLNVSISTDLDGSVGHAFIVVYDCDDRHAAGVQISIGDAGPDGSIFFYQAPTGFPSTTDTATTSVGAAGAINYPAGVIQIVATEQSTGRLIATESAVIRPGSATFAWVRVRTH
jgi:hypothetical protein